MSILQDHTTIYPAVVQIAAEHPRIEEARPHLRELAYKHSTRYTRMYNLYLDLCPEQDRECPKCKEIVPLDDYASTQCKECALAEYRESL